MFKPRGKVVLGIAMAGLICVVGCRGYTQAVDEEKIFIAFQDAMNEVLYPNELPIHGLSSYEIKKNVLPSAVKIIANTIKLIYKRTGKDIGVVEVIGALPPELEKSLEKNKEQLILQVRDILREDE